VRPLRNFGRTTDLALAPPLQAPSHAADEVTKIDPKPTRGRAIYDPEADVTAAFPYLMLRGNLGRKGARLRNMRRVTGASVV